ncbi:MAG: hypothetical protein E6Q29_09650 [Alicycliphilus sp.]|nr:MAG: hypothetical protein E6Q29_09650 [Alicycliphilus sp.]
MKTADTTDTRSQEQRHRIMQAVKGRDTGPEWIVRRLLHRTGYRYRRHDSRLPGRPDIVFPARQKANTGASAIGRCCAGRASGSAA